MTESDRELLELAAKAAGILTVPEKFCELLGVCVKTPGTWESGRWNPLTDDGEALRLAVKLRIRIDFRHCDCCVAVSAEDADFDWLEKIVTDPYAATRRAIVRAAAAIGASHGQRGGKTK